MPGITEYAQRTEGLVPADLGPRMRALALEASALATAVEAAQRRAEDAQLDTIDREARSLLEKQIQRLGNQAALLWDFHRKTRNGAATVADRLVAGEAAIREKYRSGLRDES